MTMRWVLAAGLFVAFAAVAAASNDTDGRMLPDPNKASFEEPPQLHSVYGKYRVLLRKIHVPQDTNAYGKFTDYGMYTGNAWAGYNDLPPGYWVYVYPNWYIWRDCVKPDLVIPPVRNPQPFGGGKGTGLEAPDQGANPKLNEEDLKKLIEELKKIEEKQRIERPGRKPVDEEAVRKYLEELKKIEQQQKK
jgi:hypothetical protein